MKKLFLIIVLSKYSSAIAGGPWVPGAKKGYIQIGLSALSFNKVIVDNKNIEIGKNVTDFTYQIYGEQGLGDRGLLKVVLPFKMIKSASNGATPSAEIGELSGFGNITVGGKYLVVDKNYKVSIGVDLQTPTSKNNPTLGFRTGYEALTILPYISYGQGFKKSFVSIDLGYGIMSNGYSSFVKSNVELGYKIFPKLYTILSFDIRKPLNNGNFGEGNPSELNFINNGLYVNNQLFNGVGLKLNYELKQNKFGINLSGFGAFSANNVSMSPSVNGGLYFKY